MMTQLRQRMLEKSSNDETTPLEPFDCISSTSPHSLSIFTVGPISSVPSTFVSTNFS